MSAPPSQYDTTGADPVFPRTLFAAVEGVRYALSSGAPALVFYRRGGVLLSELARGAFAIIVVGGSYDRTIDTLLLSAATNIVSDNAHHELRYSTGPPSHSFAVGSASDTRVWTRLRFADRRVYARFNRYLWAAYDLVAHRETAIQDRLYAIAYESPSNFTHYCRQYLGEDYFDNLPADEDDEAERSSSWDGDSNDGQPGLSEGSDNSELPPVSDPSNGFEERFRAPSCALRSLVLTALICMAQKGDASALVTAAQVHSAHFWRPM
ncbi:hypothetical protein K466DRAFT_568444, partial [Polyporus arcularius HHB13444]